MAGTLQELITKYSFQVDTKPIDEAQDKLQALTGFAARVAGVATLAAGAVFGLVKMTANAGDEAQATAMKLGLTVENLTRLQFAAKLSNVEAGNFNVAMRFLNRNISESTTGNAEASKAFKTLGVSVRGANGQLRPSNEVLLDIAERFKSMPDGARKTAAAMDIFGRSGADMIPLLNEGSAGIQKMTDRADALGLTMSTELAASADEFNDAVDEMTGGLTGLRNLVGAQLIPVLLPLIRKLTEWFIANRKLVASRLEFFLRTLMQFAEGALNVLMGLWRVISAITTALGGFENAVTLLTNAMLLFVGGKMLYLIGALVVKLWGLTAAFTAANVAALAIPIAIGAAVALAILLLEDLFLFFTDDKADTLFGSLLKSAQEFFQAMPAWGQIIVTYLLTPIRAVMGAFRILKTIWNGDFTSLKGLQDIGSDIGGTLKQVATGGETLGEAAGFSPAYKPAVTSRQERNFAASNSIVNNINIGADTSDPLGIAKSVQVGTETGLDKSLQKAQRSFTGKGAY